jgi:AAA+ ATPase superfamily predicted ATPase
MPDYSKYYNPYDFSNPVSDKQLFIGREKELADICYYLDQAKKAPRSINIALLGPRAAGKTSFLNMIALNATDRGYCVARIDLNEGDASSSIAFFHKIFDSLLRAACDFTNTVTSQLCFGGKQDRVYDTYLEMVSAYHVPEDKTWCPFVFPIQYAMARSAGVDNAPLSETAFKADLERISRELQAPCALLFDESNVLSANRILLEMIRNIFMNVPGYMLVFTGTPDFFPVMDEVFSPIIRQFKKIEINAFRDDETTKECIRKPLQKLGIDKLDDIFDFANKQALGEIRELTGAGRTRFSCCATSCSKGCRWVKPAKWHMAYQLSMKSLVNSARGNRLQPAPSSLPLLS